MSEEERLNELLLRWENLCEHGEAPTPEEMCRECPELVGRFRELARALAGLGRLMGGSTKPAPSPALGQGGAPIPASPRYRPTALHARGGLGEVYVAEDVELRRQVALKRMQARVAGHPDLRRRFLLEAEVTGRLEHPGVVPVYGLGLGDDGQPYYVMRFVKGDTLQEAIAKHHQGPADGRSLRLRQLLGRFVAVCQTVAYAHSRGVIHRDLKPANVLLGPYGETLVVDWGLARPVERSEADRQGGEETLTPTPDIRPDQTRGVVGTPAYMSPEQASNLQSLVGPASDVYSLGATLYHLLTGQPPFSKGPLDELLARAQRGAFPAPRARSPDVPPALEAVCLKAMALEIKDRYPSAGDLAADLERWLADEPVTSWRESLSERARRWLKRRRTAVMTAAAAGAVALVGLALSTALLGAANQREREARADAETSAARERGERERAEQMFKLAEGTSGALLDLAEDYRPAAQVQARTTELSLLRALTRYDELRREGGERPEVIEGKARVLTTLSEVRVILGDTMAARDGAREAVALYRRLRQAGDAPRYQAGEAAAREQLGLALNIHGELAAGAREHEAALALRRALGKQQPGEVNWLTLQARSHINLGNGLRVLGLDRSAEAQFRLALSLSRRAVALDGKHGFARARLGVSLEKIADCLSARGEDLAGAAAIYEEALREVTEAMRVGGSTTVWLQQQARARLSLGWTLHYMGQPTKARPHLQQALADCERFYQVDPSNREWEGMWMQARAYNAHLRQGPDPLADERALAALWREGLQMNTKRAHHDPHNFEWAVQKAGSEKLLAVSLMGLANQGQGRKQYLAEAARLLDSARPQLEKLHRLVPLHRHAAEGLAAVYLDQSRLLRARGLSEKAADFVRQYRAVLEAYYQGRFQAGTDAPLWRGRLAELHRRLSSVYGVTGEMPASLRSAREAVALYTDLRKSEPDHAPWLRDLAYSHEAAARALTVLNSQVTREKYPKDDQAFYRAWQKGPLRDEAGQHLLSASEALEELRRRQPAVGTWHTELARLYHEQSDQHRLSGDSAGEERYYKKYLDALERLARELPSEAARDPFADPLPWTTGGRLGGKAVAADPNRRAEVIHLAELAHWINRRPRLGVVIADTYIALVRALIPSEPGSSHQARWAVRRGLGLLRELRAGGALHPVHQRLIPFYEARWRALSDPREEAVVPAEWRQAWEGLDFVELARRAIEARRLPELVSVLDRLVEGSADLPWAEVPVRYRMLEGLVLVPGAAEGLIAEARKQATRLSRPGREQFAWLARLVGDAAAVSELAPAVAKAPWPASLGDVISVRVGEAGHQLLAARIYDTVIRGKKGVTAADFIGLAQVWLGVHRTDEAAAALDEALLRSRPGLAARVVRAQLLMTRRQFAEARRLIEALLTDKGLPSATATDLRTLLAWALAEEGQTEEAEAGLRGVLKEAPDHVGARATLVWVLVGQGGRRNEAGKVADALAQRASFAPAERLATAVVKVAVGQAREALPVLEKLAATEPTSFDLLVFQALGDACQQLGRRKEAVAAWKKALALFPRSAPPDDRRRRAIEVKLREALRPG